MQSLPQEHLELPGISGRQISAEHVTVVFDMTLHLLKASDKLCGVSDGQNGVLAGQSRVSDGMYEMFE